MLTLVSATTAGPWRDFTHGLRSGKLFIRGDALVERKHVFFNQARTWDEAPVELRIRSESGTILVGAYWKIRGKRLVMRSFTVTRADMFRSIHDAFDASNAQSIGRDVMLELRDFLAKLLKRAGFKEIELQIHRVGGMRRASADRRGTACQRYAMVFSITGGKARRIAYYPITEKDMEIGS